MQFMRFTTRNLSHFCLTLYVSLCSASLTPHPVLANDTTRNNNAGSSINRVVEEIASVLEQRAQEEGFHGAVRITLSVERGVDGRKVRKALAPRLQKRLAQGRVLTPNDKAAVVVRLHFSQENQQLWIVGSLEGGALLGPITFARAIDVDKELSSALGIATPSSGGHWHLEKLGDVSALAPLDAVFADIDNDGRDDIAVLTTDGVHTFRIENTGDIDSMDDVTSKQSLPARRWPRIATGWLAWDRLASTLWLATSAGHFLQWRVGDPEGALVATPMGKQTVVPIRQTCSASLSFLLAKSRVGSPDVGGPILDAQGRALRTPLRSPIRDLQRVSDDKGLWLWVSSDGFLQAQPTPNPTQSDNAPAFHAISRLYDDRIGDRIACGDFDQNGLLDVATSTASALGESDQLLLLRISADDTNATPLFRSHLSGGSIVAFDVGNLDFDPHPDLLIVEYQANTNKVTFWSLEHAP